MLWYLLHRYVGGPARPAVPAARPAGLPLPAFGGAPARWKGKAGANLPSFLPSSVAQSAKEDTQAAATYYYIECSENGEEMAMTRRMG